MAQKHINPIQNREQVIRCAEDNFTDLYANKQDKLSAQTAYSAKGTSTKVPQITTNSLGQVTGITEVNIDGYTKSEVDNKISAITSNVPMAVSSSDIACVSGKENGGNIAVVDGQVAVPSIKGNTYSYNQWADYDTSQGATRLVHLYGTSYGTATYNGSSLTVVYNAFSGTSSFYNMGVGVNNPLYVSGSTTSQANQHILLNICRVTSSVSGLFYQEINSQVKQVTLSANTKTDMWFIARNYGSNNYTYIYPKFTFDSLTVTYEDYMLIDLTLWFGMGNEPSTLQEFYKRVPQSTDFMAYNKGTLISSNNIIKSISRNILPTDKIYNYYGGALYDNGRGAYYDYNGKTLTCTKSAGSYLAGFRVEVPIGTTQINISRGNLTNTSVCKCYYVCEDAKNNAITSQSSINVSTTGNTTNIPSTTKYIRIGIGNDNTTEYYSVENIMVNIGSSKLTYEDGAFDSIEDIGELKSAGTSRDEKTGTIYIRRIGSITFDGSSDEGWSKATSGDFVLYYYSFPDSLNAKNPGYGNVNTISCDKYATASGNWNGVVTIGNMTSSNSGRLQVGITFTSSTAPADVTAWKAILASNPITVYYELSNPTVTVSSLQTGMACWENGLQVQTNSNGTIQAPYLISKEYSINIGSQLSNNMSTDLGQEIRLDNLENANYLQKSGGTMTGTIKTPNNTVPAMLLRDTSSYYAGVVYRTSGNEAVCFDNKNSGTSWIFRTKDPTANSASWNDVTPSMQIKNQRVTINKLIANDTNASYNLDVNGTANATTLYENGATISSKYLGISSNAVGIKAIAKSVDTECIPATTDTLCVYRIDGNGTATGADGHIIGMTWSLTNNYGAQIYIDTDPTYNISLRQRNASGTWQAWKKIVTENMFSLSGTTLTINI